MTGRANSVTKEDIKAGLQCLGIQAGYVLGVHSSLNSIGYVEGGADTVLEALFETVGRAGWRQMNKEYSIRAYVDTQDFQALPFYEKCGYVVYGELKDMPVGHTRYSLEKKLGPS